MIQRLFASVFITTLFTPLLGWALSFDPEEGDKTDKIKTSISAVTLGTNSPTLVALNLINAALSLLAAVCIGLLVYAGFLWVWARGNQEEVKKAKDIIQGTVIGLVIILSAYGISFLTFKMLSIYTS